ncbi:MAG: thioesterase family protein [Oscillospiraceae bacterium]|nr:thioesterase family protein [Oscillospiraceae bacterium]
MIAIGLKGLKSAIVDETNTALTIGSGKLPVFATPAMIALMETAASASVKPYLDEDSSTVGTSVNIQHISATPVGMEVRCESELIEIDRKRLVFKLAVFDECGLIGKGTHERFIINKEKFLSKTNDKRGK